MKRFMKILCLFFTFVISTYSGVSDRSLKELTEASDWIVNNRLDLIIKREDKVVLFNNLELNHSEADKTVIRESFNTFVKSGQMREAYILANISELSEIFKKNNKKMIPDLSSGALKNLIGEEFGKNFDNITVKVTGIKWQSDTIELTANVDGKNFLFPMVLNIRDINPEKDHVDQTDYFNEVKADLNSFKPANLNVKLTYKLENGKWVLYDKNFLKLLNALVFVKYYNKRVEESL